ncbi:MAG: transposase, partial [Gammaproteobacteria bacterium]
MLDEKALLTCMTYVDLNPIRAKMVSTPETSDFTSIQERIQTFLRASDEPIDTATRLPHLLEFGGEESLDRSENTIPFHLDNYIALVDWTGRANRDDKRGAIPRNLAPVFERLNMDSDDWLAA